MIRKRTAFLLAAAMVSLAFAACDKKPADTAKPATADSRKSSATPAVASRPAKLPTLSNEALQAKLLKLTDPFEVARQGSDFALTREQEKMLSDKISLLAAPLGVKMPVLDSIGLVTFAYDRISTGTYRLSFLFKVGKPVKEDFRIYVHPFVDDSDIPSLPPERRQYKGLNWDFNPSPPTPQWQTGYQVVSTEVGASDIPYQLDSGFVAPDGSVRGKRMLLGWVADMKPAGSVR